MFSPSARTERLLQGAEEEHYTEGGPEIGGLASLVHTAGRSCVVIPLFLFGVVACVVLGNSDVNTPHASMRSSSLLSTLMLGAAPPNKGTSTMYLAAQAFPEVAKEKSHLLCPATCVPSNPLFPCDLHNPYPVRFELPLKSGSMFSWRAPILADSARSVAALPGSDTVELGFATTLSKIHLRFDVGDASAGMTTWTASFFGGNRFWNKPPAVSYIEALASPTRLTPSEERLTQCACYFFTGNISNAGLDKMRFAMRTPNKDSFLSEKIPATADDENDASFLTRLMQEGQFLWSNYMVGRPHGSWGGREASWAMSIQDVCAPFADACNGFLGNTNASAAAHFGGEHAHPWVEHFQSGCFPDAGIAESELLR